MDVEYECSERMFYPSISAVVSHNSHVRSAVEDWPLSLPLSRGWVERWPRWWLGAGLKLEPRNLHFGTGFVLFSDLEADQLTGRRRHCASQSVRRRIFYARVRRLIDSFFRFSANFAALSIPSVSFQLFLLLPIDCLLLVHPIDSYCPW